MAETLTTAYCISCGEEVPVRMQSIGIPGEELLQCVHCNSYLGTAQQPQTLAAPARQPDQGTSLPPIERPGDFHPDEIQAGDAPIPDLPTEVPTPWEAGGQMLGEGEAEPAPAPAGPPLQAVITVEDSNLISAILNEMLVVEGLAHRVIPCRNGYEFLARYIRERKVRTNLGLVVMDVKMPIMNGIIAAVSMRAHETAQELEPIPLLFFTSKRCDDTFRKVLLHCAPAMYINKGTSDSPEHLQDRIGKVIRQLLREQW